MAFTLKDLEEYKTKTTTKTTSKTTSINDYYNAVNKKKKANNEKENTINKYQQYANARKNEVVEEVEKEPTTKSNPLSLIGANIASAYGQSALGQGQAMKGLADLLPKVKKGSIASKLGFKGLDTNKMENTLQDFETTLQPIQEKVASVTGPEKYLYGAIGQAPNMAMNLLSPAAGLTSMGIGAGGSKGREIEQAGGSKLAQFGGGLASGGLEVASEAIQLKGLQNVLKGKDILKNIGIQALEEVIGESGTQAIDPYINLATIPEYELPELKEQLSQIKDAGLTALTSSLLFGGAASGIQSANTAINNPTNENVQKAVQDVQADAKAKGVTIQAPSFGQQDLTQQSANQQFIDQSIQGAEFNPNKAIQDRLAQEQQATEPSQDVQAIFDKLKETQQVQSLPSQETATVQPTVFQNTKIKNEDGTPKTLYHGTGENFDTFDINKSGSATGMESAKQGFYFTDNKNVANSYRGGEYETNALWNFVSELNQNELDTVLEGTDLEGEELGNLRKNDLARTITEYDRLDDYDKYAQFISNVDKITQGKLKPELWAKVKEEQAKGHGALKEVNVNMTNPLEVDLQGKDFDDDFYVEQIEKAKSNGNDGVVFKNVADTVQSLTDKSQGELSNVYFAFNSEQIAPTTNLQQQPNAIATETQQKAPMAQIQSETGILPNMPVNQAQNTPIQPVLRQNVQKTASKVEPVATTKKAETVKTSNADISDDGLSMTMTLEELMKEPKVAEGEPIDTKTRVLTELPKKLPTGLKDKSERVYQELVSENLPFEKVGDRTEMRGSNLNRVQGTIEYNVVEKQTNMKGDEVGKSVVDIFSDVDVNSKKDLFDYMLNKHNIDRWKQEKPVFGDSIDDTISSEKIAEYDKTNPEFAEKQQEVTKYFKNLMNEWSVKSGMVSQETADMLNEEMYPNYVPTYRAKDFPKNMSSGNSNVAQIIKKAKGGEDFILPVDQQMIAMASRTIKNAKRNELMNTLVDAYEDGNESAQRYISKITDLETESVNDYLDVGSNFDTEPVVKGSDYVVNFYTDGVPRQMVVNKTLYKALEQSQSDDAINKVASAVKKYATNPFKSLITGYNPIFAASNIMRDVPTALTYSDNPLNMISQAPEAVKQMLTNGEKYKIFKAMGGTREGLIGEGKTFRVPNLNETSKAYKNAQKANPIKFIGDVNEFTETLPRFSEFMSVLEKTGDPELAIYKSAELTTDFSRHGNLTKQLDSFVAYLNPSVQGIDRFVRSAVKTPLKTAAKGAAFITLPTMLLDMINADDDDYNELSPRERNLYFNIPFEANGEKKFLRIPKSRELGVAFSSIYEWAARVARGQEVTGDEIGQAIAENFTPTDLSGHILSSAKKAWNQIKEPNAYETNYWGSLIVPESQRNYSPGAQYDLNSSGISKAIGKQFNISPYVVDYLLDSYTGIIGQVVTPIGADRNLSLLAPLESKFINDPVYKSNSINKFYEAKAEATQEAQDFNKLNNVPSSKVTPLEKKANALTKVASKLSDMRKEQKELQVKEGTEEEVKTIQEAMNRMAKKALQ